jgi:hypothetical protein
MIQQKLGSYLNLGTQFYDLIRPEPPEDAYTFYRSYVMNATGPILEPMCGTGRFLLPLLQDGFDVHGFDASEHMLEALHTKAALKRLNPTVWHAFVEDLAKTEKYSLIFIPSGSFGHIIDLDTVKKSLKVLYEHLSKDGILIFEAESSQSVPNQFGIWRGAVCHKPDGKMIIVNRLTTLDDGVCHSIDKYELVDSNRIIQTEIETFNVRLYDDPSVLIDMLKAAGFREIRMMKAFDKESSPDIGAPAAVYECKK